MRLIEALWLVKEDEEIVYRDADTVLRYDDGEVKCIWGTETPETTKIMNLKNIATWYDNGQWSIRPAAKPTFALVDVLPHGGGLVQHVSSGTLVDVADLDSETLFFCLKNPTGWARK